MEVVPRRRLRQNSPKREIGGIRLNGKGQIWLIVLEDGSKSERVLKSSEGRCRCSEPGELYRLTSEIGKGVSEGGVLMDDFFIEVCEPRERLDLFHRPRGRPI